MSTPQAIAHFIRDRLLDGGREVGIDDEVVLDGTIDSLGVTRLIDYLEKEFGVQIPPHEVTIENFRSPTTMAAMVESQRTAASA